MIPRLWSFIMKLSNTQLPRYFHSGVFNQHIKPNFPFSCLGVTKNGRKFEGRAVFRYSTMSEPPQESPPDIEILTFFKSTVDEHEGPNHCWLNKLEESKMHFGKDTFFLVLAGAFPRDSLGLGSNHILMFERVKYLQRRYPQLRVFGFHCDTSNCLISSQTHIVNAIMNEYLTFPILLTNKNFPVIKDEGCYLLFKDFKSPMLYYQERTDIGTISRAIEELGLLRNENSEAVKELKGFGAKQLDVIKEPCVFPFQNCLLHYPGCISVDEDGNRLFLSDSNHHRIIIFDGSGKILDCIGSSPGFEDGEFESAKLLRPAASLYHAVEDCLYFVDSENHAIRRADIGGRTLETIYPPFRTGNNISGIWNWVLDKLGIGREVAPKSKELDLEPLHTPWHLMKSRENNLLIVSRSFHTLWIMDPASGKIEKVVTGYPKILEICGQMIAEKVSLLKEISKEKFEQEVYFSTVEGFPIVSLVSSLATFRNGIIFCDTVGQAVLKLNRESGIISNLHLSNFGILGLPYWLMSPLENIFVGGNTCQRVCPDHLQRFSVLPGRCNIQVNIDIPVDTELAGPLQEGCIWRQARGSAAEVSGFDDMDASSEKVGVAQQWFDELDNLAFETLGDDANDNPETNIQEENRVCIHSAINISPGTSEVIIYAALYLKMKKNSIYQEFCLEENVKRILDIVNHRSGKQGTVACAQLVVKSKRGIEDIIFMKPLHLRLEFDCQDHPKADKANEVVLTDSTIEVNVSLKKNHC